MNLFQNINFGLALECQLVLKNNNLSSSFAETQNSQTEPSASKVEITRELDRLKLRTFETTHEVRLIETDQDGILKINSELNHAQQKFEKDSMASSGTPIDKKVSAAINELRQQINARTLGVIQMIINLVNKLKDTTQKIESLQIRVLNTELMM